MATSTSQTTCERLLNAKEVAEILGIKKTMVYRLLDEGVIPCLNITDSPCRRTLRVRPSALQTWLKKREVN
jgi:excisionase family DNA binding protein